MIITFESKKFMWILAQSSFPNATKSPRKSLRKRYASVLDISAWFFCMSFTKFVYGGLLVSFRPKSHARCFNALFLARILKTQCNKDKSYMIREKWSEKALWARMDFFSFSEKCIFFKREGGKKTNRTTIYSSSHNLTFITTSRCASPPGWFSANHERGFDNVSLPLLISLASASRSWSSLWHRSDDNVS